ncbi:MAG: DUF3370 domain-containing protein [Chroococcus sp. CMT-3BRIN-NPC107]|jgi:hypothetical protein|nr:DUF3370 domain-containing protein [Chroococcus sp. CMT-3BRIN-NPC107]
MKTTIFQSHKLFGYLAIASTATLLYFSPIPQLVVAQTKPKDVIQSQEVRPLPGKLDNIPVFNSNSPEGVKADGILLSTFPSTDKKVPSAHLNYPLQGRFDLFAHHFSYYPKDSQTLYLGIIVNNPGKKPVNIDVLAAASYLLPDALYVTLSPYLENNDGKVYSGPGDRAVSDVLRGIRQASFPQKLVLAPGESKMLMNAPIPVRNLAKAVNGRSTLMQLNSSDKVYIASLAMFAKQQSDPAPTLAQWQQLLVSGKLSSPRDKTPTPPEQTSGQLIYGRVAGISQGSQWQALLADNPQAKNLTIPAPGQAISYAINTLKGGRLGTGQVQTAKMLARYPDTAYESHGNYGVLYNLSIPLINSTKTVQTVTLTLATPIKEDKLSQKGARFRQPSLDFPFFRGTVRLRYSDDNGKQQTRYVHLWHRVGQVLDPLLSLKMSPSSRRLVQLELIYPPDSTPPQILTIGTLE